MGTFELANCEKTILDEIEMKELKKIDVAKTYALILKSSERNIVDWPKVNKAIINKWSRSGLEWIKEMAWSGRAFKGG